MNSATQTTGQRGGPQPAGLYRLVVRAAPFYIAQVRKTHEARGGEQRPGDTSQKLLLRDVQHRTRQMGFGETLLAMQDPTDNSTFTVLARAKPSSIVQPDPALQITSSELVEEPPPAFDPKNTLLLDDGLTAGEGWTIKRALLFDRNPRHLNGLARSLEPWFPVSATLLRMKAAIIEQRAVMTPQRAALLLRAAMEKTPDLSIVHQARARFETWAKTQGRPLEVLRDDVRRAIVQLIGLMDPDVQPRAFPLPITQLARSVLVEGVAGGRAFRFPSPQAVRSALPPDGTEGFVSPSALQLMLAQQKPAWSGIQKQDRIATRLRTMRPEAMRGLAPNEQATLLKAQAQMERAEQAIQRRRWVEWFRRNHTTSDAENSQNLNLRAVR